VNLWRLENARFHRRRGRNPPELRAKHRAIWRVFQKFPLARCTGLATSHAPTLKNMLGWWNWQTRTFEGRMPKGVGVQVPSRAPSLFSVAPRPTGVESDEAKLAGQSQIDTGVGMVCGTFRTVSAYPTTMTAPQDPPGESPETINLSHSFAREYWCTRLNTNIVELKEAVKAVGPKLEDVKRFLSDKAKARGAAPTEGDSNADGGDPRTSK
jgi:hypothetical protein